MKKLLSASAVLLLAAISSVAVAAGDPEAGKSKAVTCVACHGADGNSSIAINPKLAGQHADYLEKQLHEFKSGARANAVMQGMVAALNDQDIADIAAYYASQKASPAAASEDNLTLGESIYRGGITSTGVAACLACHGPAGNGNPAAGYPALAGQHAAYTAKTLRDFRSGARANDEGSAMRALMKRMTDEEIDAVSNYIQGLN